MKETKSLFFRHSSSTLIKMNVSPLTEKLEHHLILHLTAFLNDPQLEVLISESSAPTPAISLELHFLLMSKVSTTVRMATSQTAVEALPSIYYFTLCINTISVSTTLTTSPSITLNDTQLCRTFFHCI